MTDDFDPGPEFLEAVAELADLLARAAAKAVEIAEMLRSAKPGTGVRHRESTAPAEETPEER